MKLFKVFINETKHTWLGTEDHFDNSQQRGYASGDRLHDKTPIEDHEKHSLGLYSGAHGFEDRLSEHTSNYKLINHYHRNGEHSCEGLNDKIKHISSNLDSAIKKHTTDHPVHVWRGMSGITDNDEGPAQQLTKMKHGDTFHDKGYMSTSLLPTVAKGFSKVYRNHPTEKHTVLMDEHLAHIKVPKGSRAIYLNQHYKSLRHEHEVLLPRNSKFQYNGSTTHEHDNGDRTIIHHLTHIPESS